MVQWISHFAKNFETAARVHRFYEEITYWYFYSGDIPDAAGGRFF